MSREACFGCIYAWCFIIVDPVTAASRGFGASELRIVSRTLRLLLVFLLTGSMESLWLHPWLDDVAWILPCNSGQCGSCRSFAPTGMWALCPDTLVSLIDQFVGRDTTVSG